MGWNDNATVNAILSRPPLFVNIPASTLKRHTKQERDAYESGAGFRTRPDPTVWLAMATADAKSAKLARASEADIANGGFNDATGAAATSSQGR
jgi:cytochrome c556